MVFMLDVKFYSWSDAFFWGNFTEHCQKARQSKKCRFLHISLALLEFFPGLSQIISICEKIYYDFKHKSAGNFFQKKQLSQKTLHLLNPKLDNLKEWNRDDVLKYHKEMSEKVQDNPLFAWSRWSDANVMPSMNGLARLGVHLTKHHCLKKEELHVCPTLEDLSVQLNKISKSFGTVRRALIVPTHSSYSGIKQDGTKALRLEENAQHIITIVVEKRGSHLHVAILDPMIRDENKKINPSQIGLNLGKDVSFTEQELALSHIVQSKLDPKKTTLYHSKVLREKSNGCWAFALKDALHFLKSPKFFKEIQLEDKSESKKILGEFDLRGIDVLPAKFMKTAQLSNDAFQEYFKNHQDQNTVEMQEKIVKHQIGKHNFRIGHATVKWMEVLFQLSNKNH